MIPAGVAAERSTSIVICVRIWRKAGRLWFNRVEVLLPGHRKHLGRGVDGESKLCKRMLIEEVLMGGRLL